MEYKDYYKILDVERDANEAEIKKSYRRLARKYHPDVSKEPVVMQVVLVAPMALVIFLKACLVQDSHNREEAQDNMPLDKQGKIKRSKSMCRFVMRLMESIVILMMLWG